MRIRGKPAAGLQLAAEVDQRRDAAEMAKLQLDANKDLQKQREESLRGLNALLEQTPTAQFEKLYAVAGQLDEAFMAGEISIDQYNEAVEALDQSLVDLQPASKKAADDIDEFSKQAARNIQDALGDTVLATLKGDFDSIGRMWGNLIQKMIAEALSANLAKLLMGDFAKTGKAGGFVGDLLGMFGFHTGGVVGEKPKRYHGGGIAGDEVPAVLLKGEEVLTRSDPRHRNNAGSNGRPVVINQYVEGGMNRSEVYSLMTLMRESMRGEFRQALRTAGVA